MRTLSFSKTDKNHRIILRLLGTVFLLLTISPYTQAAAPPRAGQPYAESICNTDPNIILCEDFDYPVNFPCSGGKGSWINPALKSIPDPAYTTCSGRQIDLVSNYPSQPSGSPSGGYVKRSNVANGEGMVTGCLWGDCQRTTSDNPSGATYKNGTSLSNDLYIRFQIFFSTDYKWPFFDNKIFFLWPNKYVDKPSANIDAGMFFSNGTFCPDLNRNFNDALSFRVGSNSGNFKLYPADANAGGYAEHPEYCLGKGYGNNSPTVSTTTPPNDTPHPGTLFRFQKGKWYTVEFRYKLSSPGVSNGTIEAWINGVKVYSDSDLETCGSGDGSCAAVDEFAQYFWYNAFQEGGGLQGYGLVDNIIISKKYIGPPGESSGSPTPPSSPASLTVGP
jgi:hypothetical protein